MYETHLKAYYGMVVGHSLKQADAIVADSQSTRDDIVRFYGIAPQNITVVPLGVDAIFRQPRSAPRLFKERYFLSLMTHQKRKNIDGVLAAIANTPELRNIHYVIAGAMSQEYFDQIGAKVVALGLQNCVHLYGYAKKEDLVNLYQNAEFFIYPSFYEGFGLPVLEAMSCGCPVITSNNSSLREIVPNPSWLVDPLDAASMGTAMRRLLSLSHEARCQQVADGQQFASTFTWERCARSMIDVFHQTAARVTP
jgi:alpha-1,3-rhamnosyl/mannosyltransferase